MFYNTNLWSESIFKKNGNYCICNKSPFARESDSEQNLSFFTLSLKNYFVYMYPPSADGCRYQSLACVPPDVAQVLNCGYAVEILLFSVGYL